MTTITQSLTLGQLREDLERLASAHPACYPTNVLGLSVECGEVVAEYDLSEEDQLRRELKAAQDEADSANKEATAAEARTAIAEEEITALRAEMDALRDPSPDGETVLTYRERAKGAEEARDIAYRQMREMRKAMDEAQRETTTLRARKGVTAGLFKNVHEVIQILYIIAENKGITGERAAAILSRIKNT